ncbi:MAG TPA: hypothetical protein VK674_01350 [Candidatus Limnocylindria bacterium]|nr:hypothetical protein [Candidatus Limnocylindria bacterium]
MAFFGEKQARIEELEGELGTAHSEVHRLRGALAVELSVDPLAEIIRTELDRALATGVAEDVARGQVIVAVMNEQRPLLEASLRDDLLARRGEEFKEQYWANEAPTLKRELDEVYEEDGTYTDAEQAARDAWRAEIRQGLIEARQLTVTEEISTGPAHESLLAEVRVEVEESDEIARFTRDKKSEFYDQWRPEIVAEVKAGKLAELEAGEAGFKESYKREWLDSRTGREFAHDTERNLRYKWERASDEEIQETVQSDRLAAILAERAAQMEEKARREVEATKLGKAFERRGIDTTAIGEETVVTVYLGEIASEQREIPRTDGYSGMHRVEQTGVVYGRRISLVGLGEGSFEVTDDSLHDSESPWEQNDAIELGTVVSVGRRVIKPGGATLEPRLRPGVPLYFDTDTSDSDITNAGLDIATVKIDGVFASPVEFERKT